MDTAILRDAYLDWFGELEIANRLQPREIQMWMGQSDDLDRRVLETYGEHIPVAAGTTWDLDSLSREEALGLLVLLDQFPRNIFRTSGEAFAYDPLARGLARQLIDGGIERFHFIERFLLHLPFVHSEDVADQDYAILLSADLAVNGPESLQEQHRRILDFDTKHRDLIRRFGRYPHRNAMLGRESTPEEAAFLAEHGRGF